LYTIKILADIKYFNAVGPEDVTIVASFIVINSAKALNVIDYDFVKGPAGLLGILHHLLEGAPAYCACPAYGVIVFICSL